MNQTVINFISVCTALIATIVGPFIAIKIARSQINANVISVNRTKWIGTMRELIASTLAQAHAYVIVRGQLRDRGITQAANSPELVDRIERGADTIYRIRLMTNPNEEEDRELLATIESVLAELWSDRDQLSVEKTIRAETSRIVSQAQVILRREWVKVKQGK